jgi:hypothetical protein
MIESGQMTILIDAAHDFRFLLSRGYPRTGALTFVGNHYQLPRDQRDVLARGVHAPLDAIRRQNKLVRPPDLDGRSVAVDGHNVLITLESAMSGRVLVDCDDTVIRDIAEASGSFRPSEQTGKALDMVFDFLRRHGAASVLFLLDAPVSMSGELAAQVSATMSGQGLMGRARAVADPDAELADHPGVVASSDSHVIDRVERPVDLAGLIIRQIHSPDRFIQVRPATALGGPNR